MLGNLLNPAGNVRSYVWFSADLSLSEQILKSCNSCFLQIRDTHRIRQYLTYEVAVLVANAMVSSPLFVESDVKPQLNK